VKGGEVSDALVSQIDFLSSLGSLIHATLPKGSAPDSKDYLSTLLGRNKQGRDYVIGLSSNHVLSVLTHRWRYIEPNDGAPMIQWGPKIETGNAPVPQLYDMQAEKYETHNCAAEQPEEVFKMQTILRKERAR
jgi:arylsulphatase A